MTYEFKITVTVSGDVSESEAMEYIGFNAGASALMDINNPLFNEDNEAEITAINIETL